MSPPTRAPRPQEVSLPYWGMAHCCESSEYAKKNSEVDAGDDDDDDDDDEILEELVGWPRALF